MELSSPNIKKVLIFSPKKEKKSFSYIFSKEIFSYISGNETPHFSPQARKIKEIHHKKISYTLGNQNPKKISCAF